MLLEEVWGWGLGWEMGLFFRFQLVMLSGGLIYVHMFPPYSVTTIQNLHYLVVSTPLKNVSQIGSFPQVGGETW